MYQRYTRLMETVPSADAPSVGAPSTEHGEIACDFENSRADLHARGLVTAVATPVARSICCGCMERVLNVISAVLGIFVIAGGCLLAYQGVGAATGLNYVLWAFAVIDLIAGVYIVFRTFSLASAMAELHRINDEFEETQEKLENEVGRFGDENKKLQSAVAGLQDTNTALKETNADLVKTSADLRNRVDALTGSLNELESINVELGQAAREFESANKELLQTKDELTVQVGELNEHVGALAVENSELTVHVGELTTQTSELKNVIIGLSHENDAFRRNNADFQHENANLHGQVSRFIAAGKDFETQIEALHHERNELALANEKLRTAISALASANDASIDVGKMIKSVLADMERERDALTTEREAMEKFSLHLSSAIFAEMDLNGDHVIDASEQSAWLNRIKK